MLFQGGGCRRPFATKEFKYFLKSLEPRVLEISSAVESEFGAPWPSRTSAAETTYEQFYGRLQRVGKKEGRVIY